MKFICLVTLSLGSACGTLPWAKRDTQTVAQLQSVGLGRAYLIYHRKAIHHASGIARTTSVSKLGQRVNAIHAAVLAGRRHLEATVAQTDDARAILELNADFQRLSLSLKRSLSYRANDVAPLLTTGFGRAQATLVETTLKQLQEIDLLLSTPLRGTEKVLDN